MIVRRYVIFAVLVQLGPIITSSTVTPLNQITTTTTPLIIRTAKSIRDKRHDVTLSDCTAKGGDCDDSRGRPVCGTDDQTYPTRCHLMRAQCSGYDVSLKYRGPCKACKEAREYALKHKTKNPPKFIPRCKSDGTYAPVQCLGNTGCWCSDITGKPIEKTSVRVGKPRCREHNKSNLRRSPTRRLHTQRVCSNEDRLTFNYNLIDVFQSEYLRYDQQQQQQQRKKGSNNNSTYFTTKLILDWKFAQLDVNRNQTLDKNEFREVKKLVKRVIKPRRCGRTFGKFCDINADERLTRNEWNNCIFKNDSDIRTLQQKHKNADNQNKVENKSSTTVKQTYQITQHTTNNNNNNEPSKFNLNNISLGGTTADKVNVEDDVEVHEEEGGDHVDYENEADYDMDNSDGDSNNLSIMRNILGVLRVQSESPVIKEIENESDCFSDQTAALEEQKNGGTIIYMPDCTPDGRYQRVQCYRTTPYCWCVHEDTGKNIPGTFTSVKDKLPQCNGLYTASRPMKGCPETRRITFLKELKEFLKKSLLLKALSVSNTTKWHSENEQISTLSFIMLDKNNNKAWERKEWKLFRELVSTLKNLRKCGRKLPRYCDVNNDKRITLPEWMDCLEADSNSILDMVQISTTQNNESVTNKPTKLSGFNPLEQYLRD